MIRIDRSTGRVLALLVAFTWPPVAAPAQEPAGSTVEFANRVVGTRSEERFVVLVRFYPGATNTVDVDVTGQDFSSGPRSTCPSSPGTISKDCIVTVVFAPSSSGDRTGLVRATYGLCPNCHVDQWNLKGEGLPDSPQTPFPSCDINRDGRFDVFDVQPMVNQVLGVAAPVSDIDQDGFVTVIDLQRVINAVLGKGCITKLAAGSTLNGVRR
jgi:hypothetical protein